MVCSGCGTENPAGKKFCTGCGTALAVACSACGAVLDGDERFCGECGAPATAPEREAPVAERRLVSVLFADLVGFTTLSESRDAEDVRELLSGYFDRCRRLIERYGGTVEKFIGDAVMAVWGTPVATEDDAERAVRAALELVAAVTALGEEIGAPQLRARAGVLTGEAAVTIGAVAEGMVAGDMVNTAARIQSAAPPGEVYVGEATRRATGSAIAYEDAGAFELKGKAGLTALARAVRVAPAEAAASRDLEAPLVGREDALAAVKTLFHACAEDGKAQVVTVTGVAGIGKSRLGRELEAYLDGIPETVYWHRGRCLAYGEAIAYRALADMVRMRCRIAEDEAAPDALEKLRSSLDEYVPDPADRGFVEPRLAQLLGLGDHETREWQDLYAGWRLFFERLAERETTVLVFEDAHRADESLLEFVDYLLDWSRNHRLFVVMAARPELLERRPAWPAVRLEPLTDAAMTELLAALAPGLPADQILERAQGIPLYAFETVRMLLDRGALVRDGSSYRLATRVDSLDVPETLHALIASRLDGLALPERLLLQDGAVLGRLFTRPALAAVSGVADPEVDVLLAHLVRKELLAVQTDPRSPQYGYHGFPQELVRRIAYETLSKRTRRSRHLAAAGYLAAQDDAAEAVASHLVEAWRLGPQAPDVDELRERARSALVTAGERAAALAAAAEARRYFSDAAELAVDARERAALLDRAAQMAWRTGDAVEARRLFELAQGLFDDAGQPRESAYVSARLAEVDFMDGHLTEAIGRLEHALETLEDTANAELARVRGELGRFLVFAGDYDRAAEQLERALALAETLELHETLAQVLSSTAILHNRRGRAREALPLLERALAIEVRHEHSATALRCYNNLQYVLGGLDDLAAGRKVIDEAIRYARRIGERRFESSFLSAGVEFSLLAGDWDDTAELWREAWELATTPFARSNLVDGAVLLCERGETEAARAVLDDLADVRESEQAQALGSYAAIEARVLRAEGRPEEALAAARRVFAERERLGPDSPPVRWAAIEAFEAAIAVGDAAAAAEAISFLEGSEQDFPRAHRARFRARLGLGDPQEQFREAERLLDGLGMRFYRAVTLLEHADWLEGAPEAEPLRAQARAIFEELQARPWLERAAGVGEATPA